MYLDFVKISHDNDSPPPDVSAKHALVPIVFVQSEKYLHIAFAVEF